MKKYLALLFLCIGISCARESADYADDMIIFDNSIDYPESDLKLSDVADITYIPLKGMDEEYFIQPLYSKGNNVFIEHDVIYLRQSYSVSVYDMSGNPLRQLNKYGRGPEEYKHVSSFWVEPENNSIYIVGDRMDGVLEYDLSFNFKRRSNTLGFLPHCIFPLNADYAIVDNKYAINPEITAPYYLLSKSDWKLEPCPIEMQTPYVHDSKGYLDYPQLISGLEGTFMCNMRSDTVYWMDKSGNITPRMVDKTNYGAPDIMAVPSFETDKYLFFSLVFSPHVYPDMEERFFVFDKRKKNISRIQESKDRMFALALNECYLTCRNATLNENYGVVLYEAVDLIDNIDILPMELKKIARTLDENDNPVLTLIKFR